MQWAGIKDLTSCHGPYVAPMLQAQCGTLVLEDKTHVRLPFCFSPNKIYLKPRSPFVHIAV